MSAHHFACELRRIAELVRHEKGARLEGAIRLIASAVSTLEVHELWWTLPAVVQEELVAARRLAVTLMEVGQAQTPELLARVLLASALHRAANYWDACEPCR